MFHLKKFHNSFCDLSNVRVVTGDAPAVYSSFQHLNFDLYPPSVCVFHFITPPSSPSSPLVMTESCLILTQLPFLSRPRETSHKSFGVQLTGASVCVCVSGHCCLVNPKLSLSQRQKTEHMEEMIIVS